MKRRDDHLLQHGALQPVGQLAERRARSSSGFARCRSAERVPPAVDEREQLLLCAPAPKAPGAAPADPARGAMRSTANCGPSGTSGPMSRFPRFHASAAAASGANSWPVSSTTPTRRIALFDCRSTTRCRTTAPPKQERHQHDADQEAARPHRAAELGARDGQHPTHASPPARAPRASVSRCARRCRAATAASPRSAGRAPARTRARGSACGSPASRTSCSWPKSFTDYHARQRVEDRGRCRRSSRAPCRCRTPTESRRACRRALCGRGKS